MEGLVPLRHPRTRPLTDNHPTTDRQENTLRNESIAIHTSLLGAECSHRDGSGTIRGTVRGVFIHRDSAGSPQAGYLIELEDGAILCRYIGYLTLTKADESAS